ncbi:MAG: COX15/CtaA family protein, partial [Rhodospirillales bacterium]|nr:COX15/CtaA family protein [Rhodospirillales bacterium]
VTQVSGAFVAGLDAGLTYNTFPLMDGRWLPAEIFAMRPLYVNFFENIATVQFDHRLLAMTVLAATAWFWWWARPAPLNREQRLAINLTAAVAVVQVGLGIATLLLVVPVPLAALHQAGAVALLGAGVWAAHGLSRD